MSSLLLITGLPRSGTTFVGTILSMPETVFNIGEPFLHRVGTDHHYPYYRKETSDRQPYDRLLASIFEFEKLLQYRVNTFEPSLRGVRRYLFGSGRTLEYIQGWWTIRVLRREGRLLMKEPHALMLTLPAVQRLDCKVLVLVRHPGGQVSSKLSLGWTDRRDQPESLLDQPTLIEDHLSWSPDLLRTTDRSTVEDLGLMWRAQYAVFREFLDEVGDHEDLRVVRHEDVCLKPFKVLSDLYDWAGLSWTDEVESALADLTSADNPAERSEGKTPHPHRHRRDSSSVVDVWKERLTHEQIRTLKEVTQPTVSAFYEEDSWGGICE